MHPHKIIRAWLENELGHVWTPREFSLEFELVREEPQFAVARHRVSGKLGSLWRTKDGQFYHSWCADGESKGAETP